jgi:antitoxin ParD1/3/4
MESLILSVPESIKDFVEKQTAEGGYSTVSAYICALISAEKERRAGEELETLLLQGIRSGPATPMTEEDWDEIEREALERLSPERPQ